MAKRRGTGHEKTDREREIKSVGYYHTALLRYLSACGKECIGQRLQPLKGRSICYEPGELIKRKLRIKREKRMPTDHPLFVQASVSGVGLRLFGTGRIKIQQVMTKDLTRFQLLKHVLGLFPGFKQNVTCTHLIVTVASFVFVVEVF